MAVKAGIDVAKEFHWVAIVAAETGKVLLSRRVDNDPDSIDALIAQLRQAEAEHGELTAAIDLMGGVASLLTAMLLEAGVRLVHVPGLVVNRARRASKGGEAKSDPRDAATIADQLRLRDDWRIVTAEDDITLDLRMLVSRRRELVIDQTRRLNRLRETLAGFFPGLERVVDVTNLSDLRLLVRFVTPEEVREAGRDGLIDHMLAAGVRRSYAEPLAGKAIAAAQAQHVIVPGQKRMAEFAREFATDAIAARHRIGELENQIADGLDRHPDAALVRSLPGMGATLTAEFLAEAGNLDRFTSADQLASAAGLAPVLQQSGKMNYLRRATAGSKHLKFIFYQSAFCAIRTDPLSKAFYQRKRAEGKRHHQALIALARRRINVLYALLRTRQPYQADYRHTTATAA
ncbi:MULTISPECIES: IS110 family transposase [Pseudonocardiaceae]|uniref:IS110 family transposase n=4 Tax=Pseudonocardiaceae TaxID=2070 RepID=A0A2N3WU25_9PSEU|nr:MULTISPECIES: IS110 family transposase [Amycolatopsis]HWD05834.1 IS110 family transposase [Amycolatopsis sp.]MBB2506514.1 IS110 family transposase [Amycolatopsis echigonensis]PKV94910.1 transposase IS116/IS110/IS902 family protein [Amycolatopsis niigatensis]PKV97378.1 transposase IS116/IS110/IS902 family protein [Amycolatopsis niigatensis]PKV99870.1 transposase IS116/IS110/IS902 family protein [Amycolatopsis niigatensis]